jgi:hypothetical protein
MYASADSNEFREQEFHAFVRDERAPHAASEFDNAACRKRLISRDRLRSAMRRLVDYVG